MKDFSLTQGGVFVAVIGSLLLHFGFSQTCSNELIQLTPTLIGGVMSYIGRLRQGDVTLLGFKKPVDQ